MKRIIFFIWLVCLLTIPAKSLEISGDAVILMEEDSGRILYSRNLHKPKPIASITKIMTAVIAIETNRLDEIVKVDEGVLKAYGSNIYIEIGEEISLRDLVYGLMLRSGNDAALAIANYLFKSEAVFIERMNEKAIQLGMKNTKFVNPHGLDEQGSNISTVYDMALLTRYANSIKEYKEIAGTKSHTAKSSYKTYVWSNKNKLLSLYRYTTGGKTGFTEKARRTLVSSASRYNIDLIAVTLNDPNDWHTHQQLYEYGFNNYRKYRILNKESFELINEYYKEKLYIDNNYSYPLQTRETDAIAIRAKIIKQKRYNDKDKVGELEVYFKDNLVHVEDIYIEVQSKPKKILSWWQKILSWFKK